jgi:hypothetical protein
MFERFSDGVLGLFLFFTHWLSPGGDADAVRIVSLRQIPDAIVVSCQISVSWNEQMKDLIDAGIPIRFLFRTIADTKDTVSCVRTLQCDVAAYTYAYCDSMQPPRPDIAAASKRFSNLLIALDKFTQWETKVPRSCSACRVEAELLPTSATRLGRAIDLSQVCGYRFFAAGFVLKSDR